MSSSSYCYTCESTTCSCSCLTSSCDSGWTTVSLPKSNNTICCNTFKAMVTPVMNLVSSQTGVVMFFMRRKCGVMTLSWEPFSGQIAGNGVDKISVNQTIPYPPMFAQDYPIRMMFKGTWKVSFLRIDKNSNENMAFYLDISGNGTSVTGDSFNIPAGTVSWII